MQLLGVEALREHLDEEVALTDDVLKVLLDANTAAILRWAGAPGTVEVTVYASGRSLLPLWHEPQSVVSVTDITGTTETVLIEATHYRIRGTHLERVTGAWGERTTVEYVSKAGAAEYIKALVHLCKCDINFEPGMSSQSAGPWQQSYSPRHLATRQEILEELRPSALFA